MVKNLIALKKQNRVGYFLFFHSRNCLMKTKGSHITTNGFGLGAVERQPVRWENCAKPVLYAGTVD